MNALQAMRLPEGDMVDAGSAKAKRVRNFGGNLSFRVGRYFRPGSGDGVLGILNEVRGGSLRATGARHSWSEAVATHDSLLDPIHLNGLKVERDGDVDRVTVGAGCSINKILGELRRQEIPLSLPTFGIIGKQSIAGAVSTATHGSGFSSMSNQVVAARIAAYARGGSAEVFNFNENDEALEAARCAVGCMGVLLELRLNCVKRWMVSETVGKADTLEAVLEWEDQHPLQQFYLHPIIWKWHAQLRKKTNSRRSSWLERKWYYLRRLLKIELFFNLSVKLLANIPGCERLFPSFYRLMYDKLKEGGKDIVDYADRLLMMKDDLFRHTEMELFVRPDRLHQAASFIEGVLRYCAGEIPPNFGSISQIVSCHGDPKAFAGLKDSYVHHYPITFRKVLKDDTMISMTNGGDRYAVSFITYKKNIDSFEAVMAFLASVMASAFDARPHWGKLMPLGFDEIERLYPRLPEFRGHCEDVDPQGVFRNRFVRRKMWPRPQL